MTKTLKLTKAMTVINTPSRPLYNANKALLEVMDYKAAKRHLACYGITLYFNREYNEYRINKGNREATAYYTDDLQDAIGTAYSQYIDKE